ncbi:hypothetical protein [Neobacillus sp. FSL H8-0543]
MEELKNPKGAEEVVEVTLSTRLIAVAVKNNKNFLLQECSIPDIIFLYDI